MKFNMKEHLDKLKDELMISVNYTNPNLVKDIKSYLNLANTEHDIQTLLNILKEEKSSYYEKLITLIDRIEFIYHLTKVNFLLQDLGYIFKVKNKDYEVLGIEADIWALQAYLALTCIDIFSVFTDFKTWLINNLDQKENEELSVFIERKSKEHNETFGTGKNFLKAFQDASMNLRNKIMNNTIIVIEGNESSQLSDIAHYFYFIRNKYTHEGKRFILYPTNLTQFQKVGMNSPKMIKIRDFKEFYENILEVAKENAIRMINLLETKTGILLQPQL